MKNRMSWRLLNCRSDDSRHFSTIDAMRGIASLMVCLYHFTQGNGDFLKTGLIKKMGSYGYLGVDVFFVISGFIIPFSLYKMRFKIQNYGTFMLKRLIRLEPPYLISIVLVISLNYISTLFAFYRGEPFSIDLKTVLMHVGYLNVFTGSGWLNPVYWSLAIEFQYYLGIAILFPFIFDRAKWLMHAVIVSLVLSVFILKNPGFIFVHMPMFVLGIVSFLFYINRISSTELAFYLAGVGFILFYVHPVYFIVGLASVSCILFLHINVPILNFLGMISYSLYLIHVPVGGRLVNLATRFERSDFQNLVLLLSIVCLSIGAAYLYFLIFERPFQRWSSRIKY